MVKQRAILNNNTSILWLAVVAVGSLLYGTAFIWQGVDLTDTGFHLAAQQNLLRYGLEYGSPIVWLTDFAGGVWLLIVGDLGLLGARIGWALLISLTASVSYIILSKYFPPKASALAILLATAAATHSGLMLIFYYTLPTIALLIFAGLCLSLFDPERAYLRPALAVTTGFLFAVCVGLRLPLLGAVFLPVTFAFVLKVTEPDPGTYVIHNCVILLISGAFFLLIALVLLWQTGDLESLTSAISLISNVRARNAQKLYLRQFHQIIMYALIYMAILLTVLIFQRSNRFRFRGWFAPLVTAAGVSAMLFISKKYWAVSLAVVTVSCIMLLLLIVTIRPRQREHIRLFLFFLTAVSIPYFITIGSSGGLKKTKFGLWLALGAVGLGFHRIVGFFPDTMSRFSIKPRDLRRTGMAVLACLALFGGYERVFGVYRDNPDRRQLFTPLRHERLWGIHTTPERADSLNELLDKLDDLVEPGDPILVYNSAPLIYYLTKTRPILGRNWIVINNMSTEVIRHLTGNLCQNERGGGTPKVIVKAKTNTRDPNWGGIATRELYERYATYLGELERAIDRCEPKLVWSNHDFAIFVPGFDAF